MATYVETIRDGESIIVCDDCGEQVTAELRHEREHAARAAEAAVQTGTRPYGGEQVVDTRTSALVPGDLVLVYPVTQEQMQQAGISLAEQERVRAAGATSDTLIKRVDRMERGVLYADVLFTDGTRVPHASLTGNWLRVDS